MCLCYNTGSYSYEVMRKWKALPQCQRYANKSEDSLIEISFLVGKTEDMLGWRRSSKRMQNGEYSQPRLCQVHILALRKVNKDSTSSLYSSSSSSSSFCFSLIPSSKSDSDLDKFSCSDGTRQNLFYILCFGNKTCY